MKEKIKNFIWDIEDEIAFEKMNFFNNLIITLVKHTPVLSSNVFYAICEKYHPAEVKSYYNSWKNNCNYFSKGEKNV